ncbi:DUF998 domain-containing protein [Secundilactobacillus similis]|uniref:DUF998 domain-containing protein n=1 Tax=Secundilactobacillus similis TaxID=414682 RepID=UPI000AC075A6|nr:DUF998 domain-containing protein [Secundilactobacillus similis]
MVKQDKQATPRGAQPAVTVRREAVPTDGEVTVKMTLPARVVDQLKVSAGDTVKLELRNHNVLLQSADSERSLFQRISLWWYLAPGLFCSILFNIFFAVKNQNQIPLSGETSLATTVILMGVIMGTILFGIFFIRERRNQTKRLLKKRLLAKFSGRDFILCAYFRDCLMGVFWLFNAIFNGATFDRLTATIIFFVFETMINYVMIFAAFSLSSRTLIRLFTAVIVGGVVISMATNSSRRWWQYNLSFLGTHLAQNSWQFNMTLMFSALLMVALTDYIFVSLAAIYPRSLRLLTLRIVITLMAVDLGAVGFFPNNQRFHFLHDQVAGFLVYFIIGLIVGIRWLLPGISKEFLRMSYTVGAILVVADVLFQFVGYLSLTAFEIIGFALAFGWVIVLFQLLQELIDQGTRLFEVEVE